ncbi:hypothetical protein AVEN_74829-1 [Araneus ventricosus]|uniref:Uncharacterized protein n=1 Tax=Araneus ventricosus TaxID=182803 RepID=A0A4Y2V8W8_ARAVE|nr:hypothetical protein AVEN_74829-1 [Araneus ventricosus]
MPHPQQVIRNRPLLIDSQEEDAPRALNIPSSKCFSLAENLTFPLRESFRLEDVARSDKQINLFPVPSGCVRADDIKREKY